MVTSRIRFLIKCMLSSLLTLLMVVLLAGCGPATRVSVAPDFKPGPEQEAVYVVPFVTTLVPDNFSENVFDTYVDELNDNHAQTNATWFAIIKEDLKNVNQQWLAKQFYITGEIWSYIENSGCCSTELRVKARLQFYEVGKKEPSMEVFIPLESFFDHDRSDLAIERDRLAKRLATEMTAQTLKALRKR
jgi:hypothetical protein